MMGLSVSSAGLGGFGGLGRGAVGAGLGLGAVRGSLSCFEAAMGLSGLGGAVGGISRAVISGSQ